MSRIRTIDTVFEGMERVYLNFVEPRPAWGRPEAVEHGEATEYFIDSYDPGHLKFVEATIAGARFVYVHTVHLARYILPFYATGKVVTDVHGIVPEEERMLGRPAHGDFYEAVESVALLGSALIVVVTEAMRDHLLAKHTGIRAEFLVIPIVERHEVDWSRRRQAAPGDRVSAIYAGGTQVWQCVPEMVALARKTAGFCDTRFLSHQVSEIQRAAEAAGLTVGATFGVADKAELARAYLESDFGYALRDDTAVSRVACPTKLFEYLFFGVIPIVKSPALGDFPARGYAYVRDVDFAAGRLPDPEQRETMRSANRRIVEDLSGLFALGATHLRRFTPPQRLQGGDTRGLPIGHRHLALPSQAECYLIDQSTTHLVVDVAEPYACTTFAPAAPAPASIVRIVPFLGEAWIRFRAVYIEVENLDFATAPCVAQTSARLIDRHGPAGSPGEGGFLFDRQNWHVDIPLGSRLMVKRITVEAEFLAVGADARLIASVVEGPTTEIEVPLVLRDAHRRVEGRMSIATPKGAARQAVAPAEPPRGAAPADPIPEMREPPSNHADYSASEPARSAGWRWWFELRFG